jgi:hypothetical protein
MWIYHKDISDIRERNMNYELLRDTQEVTLGEMTNMSINEPKKPTSLQGWEYVTHHITIVIVFACLK